MHWRNLEVPLCCFIMASWVVQTIGEESFACVKGDKEAFTRKVVEAMIQSVEAMYKSSSVFRKKRTAPTMDETASFPAESIFPVEIQRIQEKALKLRRSFFQSKKVKDDVAVSKVVHNVTSEDDSVVQEAKAEGNKVGVAEAILQRSKRFCVPTSYSSDYVRGVVEKLVNETFFRIEHQDKPTASQI